MPETPTAITRALQHALDVLETERQNGSPGWPLLDDPDDGKVIVPRKNEEENR